MRINFDNDYSSNSVIGQAGIHRNEKAKESGALVDASAFAMSIGDNGNRGVGIYSDTKAADEWQDVIDAGDVQLKRDYMSVMSLSMSDEDYARLVATGQVPEDMDAGDCVSIVDDIKAAIIKGGTQVAGYTDTIDRDTLAEITGSVAMADELVKAMTAQDVPVNTDNIKAAAEAVNKARQIVPPSEAALQYLMDNGKAPTIKNLYEAEFSGKLNEGSTGAYLAQGGYMTRLGGDNISDSDMEALMPQIEGVITQSGLTVDEKTKSEALWLIDKGIGLTRETLLQLDKLSSIQSENIVNAVSIAMGAGIAPDKANLTYTESIYTMAEAYYDRYVTGADAYEGAGTDGAMAVNDSVETGIRTDVAGLNETDIRTRSTADLSETDIQSRRILEEIRLTMTVEANRLLLRSNFQIDIAPMEELIEALKEAERVINSQRFPDVDEAVTNAKAGLYAQTKEELAQIPTLPAAVLGEKTSAGEWRFANIQTYSLHEVYESGVSRRDAYIKAEQSYEALMTAPRADMGDSIRKAFRNVDDILEDMDIEIDDINRRAVRILGYNSLEINPESVNQIREADENLRGVLSRLTPHRVLEMIRDNVNPLNMTVAELGDYLNSQDDEPERKAENYARFLMQLERQDEISELERESYIGIYRMLASLDKTDDAAIGAIVHMNMDMSFANILSAMRTAAKSHMDVSVSDSFGGVDIKRSGAAIDAQINAAFTETTDERAMGDVLQTYAHGSDDMSFSSVTDSQITDLISAGLDVSINNMEVSELFRKRKADWFETVKQSSDESELEEAIGETLEAFDSSESAIEAYDAALESFKEKLSDAALNSNAYIDVKAIQSSMRQISFLQKRAQNETYEFPADIDGEMTSIRLQFRHISGAGELVITLETERFGKLAAQFNLASGKSGYIAYEKAESAEYASALSVEIAQTLSFAPDVIHAPEISLDKFESDASAKEKSSKLLKEDENKTDINTTELYRIAKVFISKARRM